MPGRRFEVSFQGIVRHQARAPVPFRGNLMDSTAGIHESQSPPWERPVAPSEEDGHRPTDSQELVGKPRLMPPWLGSSQREVTALLRVKKCTPSGP